MRATLRRSCAALACAATLAAGHAAFAAPPPPPVVRTDPWNPLQIVRPADLARAIAAPGDRKPMLLHVGFRPLFKAGAIPGSRYLGPGSRPEGIAALRQAMKDVPRGHDIVLYCGCCPWDHCPNVRPAFLALKDMHFTHVRVLYVARNLESDWVDAGYPIGSVSDSSARPRDSRRR